MAELQNHHLPPGWECKLDAITGKYYFINHYTKTTTWDDPRNRHIGYQGTPKHFSNVATENIPLQHGSPDLRRNYVYPSQTTPRPAFQMPPHQSPKSNPLQELRNISRMSPLTVRGAKVQDSCLTVHSDTDDAVAKISAMFPTVSDSHIRLLMKKYHNREALVISALQVEKNPITTPGPFATPPPQRNIHHPSVYALHMTPPLGLRTSSRGGSPVLRPGSGTNSTYTGSPRIGEAFRSSPRPHSSPKLKLSCRYMKSIFPQAEETVILDILYNNDNNIQKTSDKLKEMGFERKDTVKIAQQKIEAKQEAERVKAEEKKNEEERPGPALKLKTAQEKAALKAELKEKYKDVAEHLITLALESVDFNEKKASQILDIMVQENNTVNEAEQNSSNDQVETVDDQDSATELPQLSTLPVSQSRQSIKSLLRSEKSDRVTTLNRIAAESESDFKSANTVDTKGPNPGLIRGPNDSLLLSDYVDWQGPNSNSRKGPQGLAKGPDRSLLTSRTYQPRGANAELHKGPKFGLAKGSIFSQLKNGVMGESRGK